MAHEIETMAYMGAKPWHGLGVEVGDSAGRDHVEMLKAAGLDWQVELVRLQLPDTQQLVDRYASRRKSDGKVLGTVGDRYVVLQNEKAFEWFAPFIEAGEATLHTAGSLRDGSRVWVLAKLNRDPLVIKGNDTVEKYLLLSHSHDGSLAIRVGFTPIRVVCANTLAMSHEEKASSLIRIRHSKQAQQNLDAVRDVMNTVNASFEATAEQYRLLAHKDICQADVLLYVKVVFNLDAEKELSARAKAMVAEIEASVEAGMGNAVAGVRGTWWAAYNGVTEYLSHSRGRSADTRLNSLWFGDAFNVNRRALATAVEMAAA